MRALSRLTDLALSSRASLGVAASVDGLLRVSPELIVPIISVTGGIFGSSDVATATTWLLFFTMLYEFAPLAYSRFERSEAVFSRSNREFRFLFAVGGCAAGLAWMKALDSGGRVFSAGPFLSFICVVTVAGGGVIAYLSQRHNWDVLNPEGPAVAMISRLGSEQPSDVVDEVKTDLSQEGWKRSLAVAGYSLSLLTVFGFPIAIAGIVLFALSGMFPVIDLILFVWAVSIRVFPRLSAGPEKTQLAELTADLQEFFIDSIEYVTSSMRGMSVTMYIFLGIATLAPGLGALFPTLGYLPEFLYLVVTNNASYQQAVHSSDIDTQWLYLFPWNYFGTICLILIGLTNGIWVWIRELKRLPAAVAVWNKHPTKIDISPPPRVPGFTLLPATSIGASFLWITTQTGEPLNRTVAIYDWVFAVVCPTAVIVTLWAIRMDQRARRSKDSHSVTHEHWWVAVGLGIQLTGLLLFKIDIVWIASIFLIVFAGMGMPECYRYAERFDDIRQYVGGGFIILIGVGLFACARILSMPNVLNASLALVFLGIASVILRLMWNL